LEHSLHFPLHFQFFLLLVVYTHELGAGCVDFILLKPAKLHEAELSGGLFHLRAGKFPRLAAVWADGSYYPLHLFPGFFCGGEGGFIAKLQHFLSGGSYFRHRREEFAGVQYLVMAA
jgi:hypothetical protein